MEKEGEKLVAYCKLEKINPETDWICANYNMSFAPHLKLSAFFHWSAKLEMPAAASPVLPREKLQKDAKSEDWEDRPGGDQTGGDRGTG